MEYLEKEGLHSTIKDIESESNHASLNKRATSLLDAGIYLEACWISSIEGVKHLIKDLRCSSLGHQ